MKEVAELKAKLEAAQIALQNEEIRRSELEYQIAQLLGKKYTPSSEKLSIEQLELKLESLCPSKPKPKLPPTPETKKHYKSKKAEFPDDLPTEIVEVEIPEKNRICPDTGKPRELIRYEESVKFDWVSGYFRRVVIKREVRAAKYSESDPLPGEPVVTAEMPAEFQVIPGCFASVRLMAHILVSKYCDHLPLYRQQ